MTKEEVLDFVPILRQALEALMLQPRAGDAVWTTEQAAHRVMAKRALRRALEALQNGLLEVLEIVEDGRQEVEYGR